MAILILAVCFAATFLSTGVVLGTTVSKKEVWLGSMLIFALYLLFITEFLTVFSLINYTSLVLCWGAVTIANILHLYRKKTAAQAFITSLKADVGFAWKFLSVYEKAWLYAAILILLLVFGQGVIYPPNNWDSMTYHLSRVTSWVSRGSVDHFPSHIYYQIYQGPFAEYGVMHLNILARGDYFAFFVQFFAFTGIIIATAALVKTFGMPRRYRVMAVVLLATLPEAILQASSTQNDVTAAFFMAAAMYFAVRCIKQPLFRNFFFLGLGIGFALLTKATAYLYMAPVLLVFGIAILVKLFKSKLGSYLGYAVLAAVIAIAINARQYNRNYHLSGNVLGTQKTDMDMYNNKKISPLYVLSGIIKNAGLQSGIVGSTKTAIVANDEEYKLHKKLGININDPDNNFTNSTYHIMAGKANHEDYASNLIHLVLIIVATLIICVHGFRKDRNVLVGLLLLVIFMQVCLFCGYLKWQIWNTRLHTPAFLFSVPLICYAVYVSKWYRVLLNVIIPLLILYALMLVLRNATRPYIGVDENKHTSTAEMFAPRFKKYFENRPYLYGEYKAVSDSISKLHYKNIGLMIGTDDWEYPIFANCYTTELNPVHLNVRNISRAIPNLFTQVDCIVSTYIDKPYIDYNGKRFYNRDAGNKHLYFYR